MPVTGYSTPILALLRVLVWFLTPQKAAFFEVFGETDIWPRPKQSSPKFAWTGLVLPVSPHRARSKTPHGYHRDQRRALYNFGLGVWGRRGKNFSPLVGWTRMDHVVSESRFLPAWRPV